MNFRNKLRAALSVGRVRFLDRQIPLFLSWPVTNRCNYRCSYCDRPNQVDSELSTARALQVVDEFADLGTQFVFLSGGEPLVRKDLPEIVSRCRDRKLFTCLTTNGALYLQRKLEIGRVNMLKVSLDGPAAIHDGYRAAGSFAEVMVVLEDARKDAIPVMLNPVISKANINDLDEIRLIGERFGATVKYQPINRYPAGEKSIDRLALDEEDHKRLATWIGQRRRSSRSVANSRSGARYIGELPVGGPIPCWAGRLFVYLMPNGDLYPCNKRGEIAAPQSCVSQPVALALRAMERVGCQTCWCTSDAELNLMMKLAPSELIDLATRALGL